MSPTTRKRTLVILAGALGLLGITGGLMMYLSAYQLPAPQDTNREQLVRWLATRDLSRESYGVRADLITRLQSELDAGVDLAEIDQRLDARSEAKLRENVDVLLGQWFVELAQEYQQTEASRRDVFLDDQLERIERWRLAEYLSAKSAEVADARKNPLRALAELSQRLRSWADSAPADERDSAHEFADVIQARIAWHAISSWREGTSAQ